MRNKKVEQYNDVPVPNGAPFVHGWMDPGKYGIAADGVLLVTESPELLNAPGILERLLTHDHGGNAVLELLAGSGERELSVWLENLSVIVELVMTVDAFFGPIDDFLEMCERAMLVSSDLRFATPFFEVILPAEFCEGLSVGAGTALDSGLHWPSNAFTTGLGHWFPREDDRRLSRFPKIDHEGNPVPELLDPRSLERLERPVSSMPWLAGSSADVLLLARRWRWRCWRRWASLKRPTGHPT